MELVHVYATHNRGLINLLGLEPGKDPIFIDVYYRRTSQYYKVYTQNSEIRTMTLRNFNKLTGLNFEIVPVSEFYPRVPRSRKNKYLNK